MNGWAGGQERGSETPFGGGSPVPESSGAQLWPILSLRKAKPTSEELGEDDDPSPKT